MEQARVFEAVARLGTLQKAAKDLHKAHSAILYSLKALEAQVDLPLFDRSQYRNTLTSNGLVVLSYCQKLLATRTEMVRACRILKAGWEPSIKLIYDGVVDFNLIADALYRLDNLKAPTDMQILSAHLDEVSTLFETEGADIMLTILPQKMPTLSAIPLHPITMNLVAHAHHPLGLASKGRTKTKLTFADLNQYAFIRIKTTATGIGLSTDGYPFQSHFYVNDFATKKLAIHKRLGFGWLPDYLASKELRQGQLTKLKTEFPSSYTVKPHLYFRPGDLLGHATKELVRFFGE